jgi:hypothetical protein
MAEQSKFGALGAVLAKNLNEIEDLPNYIAPPPGVYKLMIDACGQKTINDKTVIAVDYVFLELKSLNDNADEHDKAEITKVQWGKDRMSEVFYFNDPERIETTLGVLKKKFGPMGPQLGTTNLLEILEKLPNLTIDAQIGRRKDDNDSTKFYPYTRTLVLAV